MDDLFHAIAARSDLPPAAVHDLRVRGFVIVPGPVPEMKLPHLAEAYDRAIREAAPEDASIGSSTTRVHDFVNRSQAFDSLYIHSPVLEACCRTIGQPFKLSTMHGRTLRPRTRAQKLHMDFPPDGNGWPMVGFILMIDAFRKENGATLFLPGSHGSPANDGGNMNGTAGAELVPACGPAGSMIVFNGSVWHGHGANETDLPRRSIQGAYIRRDEKPAIDFAARMRPETLARISPLARYLLAV